MMEVLISLFKEAKQKYRNTLLLVKVMHLKLYPNSKSTRCHYAKQLTSKGETNLIYFI